MTRVFLGLLFLGVLTAGVAAQTSAVTKLDLAVKLETLKMVAVEKRLRMPFRMRSTWNNYYTDFSTESVYEQGGDGSVRYVGVVRNKGVESRSESITVGGVRYARDKNGNWIKEVEEGSPAPPTPKGSKQTAEYLHLGREKINGQDVEHYRTIRTAKWATGSSPAYYTDDYWINSDGLMVRQTSETSVDKVVQYRSAAEYEYPKEIKIDAPIPD